MPKLRAQMEVGAAGFLRRMMRCHGIPERCLVVAGHRMPVCARCFGSYLGNAVAVILFIFRVRIDWVIGLALTIPMGIDWGLQRFKGMMSTNPRRFITGLLAGVGMGMAYLTALIGIITNVLHHIK